MTTFNADVLMPTGVEVTLDRLKAVLESLDRAKQPTVLDERSISVRTKVSFKSWGELVTCTIIPADGGLLVRVESTSSVVTTLIDYGANRRNVEQVVRALNAMKG